MNITCTTQQGERINGSINKKNGIRQEAQGLHFYHFAQENNQKEIGGILSGRLAFDKNSDHIKSFQFKNNCNTKIFQLLDNISIDRGEGLCNELRGEKKPVIVI